MSTNAKQAAAKIQAASTTVFPSHTAEVVNLGDVRKDYFIERDGVKFAGVHLLVDLWGAHNLDDPALIEQALTEAAVVSGATILHSNFHHFSPNGGVSGVVVLSESHISIHTWPERDFAALDIFMCGACDPHKAMPVLRKYFRPASVMLGEQRRGMVASS